MKPRKNGSENFVMVFTTELYEHAVLALKEKRLQPRDLAVLVAMLSNADWRSGRIKTTARGLAEQMGIQQSNCTTSISRLRAAMLVSHVYNVRTGDSYYLINPYVASVGSPQRRGMLMQQFRDSLE